MRSLIFAFLILFTGSIKSQMWDYGFGVSGIVTHNINVGAGARALLHFKDDVVGWTPQINYFPGLFQDQGFTLGLQFQYNFRPYKPIGIYPLLNAYYANFEEPLKKYTEMNNGQAFIFEAGVGVQKNEGCMRPFAEVRYSYQLNEANARVGLLFMMSDCFPPAYCQPTN